MYDVGCTTQANVKRQIRKPYRIRPRADPGYQPRQFNALTRRRFLKARQLHYLGRIQDEPTEAQIAMARSLPLFEWGALAGEHEGTLASLREAREHRRLLLKTLVDFEQSMRPARMARSGDYLGSIHQRFGPPPR
jgi:hypothetical protein